MYCKYCGKQNIDSAKFCKHCGEQLDDNVGIANSREDIAPQAKQTKGFFMRYKSENIDLPTAERNIKNAWIAGIVLLGVGVVGAFFEPLFWVDVVIVAFLVLGVYKKNVFGAIALPVYFAIAKILQLVSGEGFGGVLGTVLSVILFNYFLLGAISVVKYRKIKRARGSTTKGVIIGIVVGVLLTSILGYFVILGVAEEYAAQTPTAQNIVFQADYDEGYKAGYADGRTLYGTFGDNYHPPVTADREEAYVLGYMEGYKIGCDEGGFDCSEVEEALRGIYQEYNPDPEILLD